MRLKDKVAIVTGAGSGIGRATALAFAQEGARVVLADRNQAGGATTLSLVSAAGGDAHLVVADVSRGPHTERIVDEAVRVFGRLDALINNAAVMIPKAVPELSEEEWDHVLGVNLKGVFLCSKQAILCFRRQGGGGTIVNMASVNSFYAEGGIAAYCAAKGGVQQLTRAMAIDHSAEGIRVNCICPGWIDTPINAGYFADPAARAFADKLHAIGRIGQPAEIASVAAFPGQRRCVVRDRSVDRCGRWFQRGPVEADRHRIRGPAAVVWCGTLRSPHPRHGYLRLPSSPLRHRRHFPQSHDGHHRRGHHPAHRWLGFLSL